MGELLLTILIIAGLYGFILVIGWIIQTIEGFINRKKEAIRERVADEKLKDTDIEDKIKLYKKKLEKINYERKDELQETHRFWNEYLIGSFGKFLGKCPKCKSGYLTAREGKFGKFIGCSKYPNCKYTKKIKEAKTEYKKIVSAQLIGDIRKAYL